MKKTVIVTAAIALLIGPAAAADMPLKAQSYAAARWTGCYIGVNGGYGWNNGHSNYRDDPNTIPDPINGISSPNTGTTLFVPAPSPSGKGWVGGAGAGCNWQSGQWVFGVEADIDGGDISGSQTTRGPAPANDAIISTYFLGPQLITANGSVVATGYEHVSVQWLSTMRGRLGFAVQDRLMLFATGGLAFGGVSTNGNVNIGIPPSIPLFAGSNSETRFGYVIGGGAEWAFADHWTAKAEYLWYDLGTVSHPLNCTPNDLGCGGLTGVFATLGNTSSSVHGSIARLGINYLFN